MAAELAAIETDYNGYGQSWVGQDGDFAERWVLSELDSLYGIGFLSAANLQMAHERVTSRTVVDEREIERYDRGTREWCLCDGVHFYHEDEQSAEYVLRDLADGRDLACDDLHTHRARYDEIVGQSAYKDMRA